MLTHSAVKRSPSAKRRTVAPSPAITPAFKFNAIFREWPTVNACDNRDEDGDDGADMMVLVTMMVMVTMMVTMKIMVTMMTILIMMSTYCYNYSDSTSTFESATLSKRRDN